MGVLPPPSQPTKKNGRSSPPFTTRQVTIKGIMALGNKSNQYPKATTAALRRKRFTSSMVGSRWRSAGPTTLGECLVCVFLLVGFLYRGRSEGWCTYVMYMIHYITPPLYFDGILRLLTKWRWVYNSNPTKAKKLGLAHHWHVLPQGFQLTRWTMARHSQHLPPPQLDGCSFWRRLDFVEKKIETSKSFKALRPVWINVVTISRLIGQVIRIQKKQPKIPSGKLTKQWNIPMFHRKYIFNPGPFSSQLCSITGGSNPKIARNPTFPTEFFPSLPSKELTYPPKMGFWRGFSFSQGGICDRSLEDIHISHRSPHASQPASMVQLGPTKAPAPTFT